MVRFAVLLLLSVAVGGCCAQTPVDSDRDGLSDALEDALLQQFAPRWMVSATDCSVAPARFVPGVAVPTVAADDGTIYGQAMPGATAHEIELHFYHLWRKDCGRLGHALDAEHVSTLLRSGGDVSDPKSWRAVYWYAAAHEDTVCDASQVTRARVLDAETHGATIWVSGGKHASFLTEELCRHGCGADRCEAMRVLESPGVVNLGEWKRPGNGAVWMASPRWPMEDKLRRSDFTPARVQRLGRLQLTEVAWANPANRPAQAAIMGGNAGVDGALLGLTASGGGLATGARAADAALGTGGDKTGAALGSATRSTGRALGRSWRAVKKALGGSKD